MKRLTLAILLAAILLVMTVFPAFAIVHPVAPICTGVANSNGAAGGAAAFPATSGNASNGPPFPAQGSANSGTNACP